MDTYCVSVVGTCHQKGSNFQRLSGTGVYFIVQILERGSNIPVLKGVPACLEKGCLVFFCLELEYHK